MTPNGRIVTALIIGLGLGSSAVYYGTSLIYEFTDESERLKFTRNDLRTVMTKPYSDLAVMTLYTPPELRTAIDSDNFDYDKLSPFVKMLVDSVETP